MEPFTIDYYIRSKNKIVRNISYIKNMIRNNCNPARINEYKNNFNTAILNIEIDNFVFVDIYVHDNEHTHIPHIRYSYTIDVIQMIETGELGVDVIKTRQEPSIEQISGSSLLIDNNNLVKSITNFIKEDTTASEPFIEGELGTAEYLNFMSTRIHFLDYLLKRVIPLLNHRCTYMKGALGTKRWNNRRPGTRKKLSKNNNNI
jgi:hypothetical protein